MDDRWVLIRDVAVFQVKLALDGLRDLLLSPVSLVAAAVGLVVGGDRPGRFFYDLLRVGRRSDHWIGLFTAAPPLPGEAEAVANEEAVAVDTVVARLERMLVQEVERGGLTMSAKGQVDRLLDRVQGAANRDESLR